MAMAGRIQVHHSGGRNFARIVMHALMIGPVRLARGEAVAGPLLLADEIMALVGIQNFCKV